MKNMKIKEFVPLAIGSLIVGILMELLLQIPEFCKGHEYTIKEFLIGSILYGTLLFFVELFSQWYTKRYNKKKAEKNNNKSNRATNV